MLEIEPRGRTALLRHSLAGKGRLPDLTRIGQRDDRNLPHQARETAEMELARDGDHA